MASAQRGMSSLAGRYAVALYDLASDQKAVESVASDFAALKAMLAASPDMRRLVRSPALTPDQQIKGLSAVMQQAGLSGLLQQFVGVLARNRRLFALDAMADAYRAEVARRRGEIEAKVTVARPLTEAQDSALTDALKAAVGSKVQISKSVDPNLLGGVIVRVGSRMIDNSIRSKIDRLQLALKAPEGAL